MSGARDVGAPLGEVEAVSYDLWLTLIADRDPKDLWGRRVHRLEPVLHADAAGVRRALEAAHGEHRAAWDEGRALPFREIAAAVLRGAGQEVRGPTVDLVVAALDEPTLQSGVQVLPDAADTLARICAAGLPVGLVCDTGFTSGAALRGVLAEVGLLASLRVLVFSEELGTPKPWPGPFDALVAGLPEGIPRDRVVHVGDLRRKDGAGARDAGMRSVRYRGARDDEERDGHLHDADHVIDSHPEVLTLLGLDGS